MTAATTPLTYNAFVTAVASLAVVKTTTVASVVQLVDVDLQALLPQVLNYSELRIQRDTDLLALQTSAAYSLTAGNNILAIPTTDFVTVQTLSVAGVPLTPTSKEFLQNVYGTASGAAAPTYFAPYGGDSATAGVTSNNFIVGPWPDQSYGVSVTGTVRMPTLALYATTADAATKVTFISEWLPDLLLQASMIFVSAFQRNFSSTGNDPQMPINYEQQYGSLLRGAQVEEARKRFSASAWSSMAPPIAATPGR